MLSSRIDKFQKVHRSRPQLWNQRHKSSALAFQYLSENHPESRPQFHARLEQVDCSRTAVPEYRRSLACRRNAGRRIQATTTLMIDYSPLPDPMRSRGTSDCVSGRSQQVFSVFTLHRDFHPSAISQLKSPLFLQVLRRRPDRVFQLLSKSFPVDNSVNRIAASDFRHISNKSQAQHARARLSKMTQNRPHL